MTQRKTLTAALLLTGLTALIATGCVRDRFIGEQWGATADRARTTWFLLRPARAYPSLHDAVFNAYGIKGVDRVRVDDEATMEGSLQVDLTAAHLMKVEHRLGDGGVSRIQYELGKAGFDTEEVRNTGVPRRSVEMNRPAIREFDGPSKVSSPGRGPRTW